MGGESVHISISEQVNDLNLKDLGNAQNCIESWISNTSFYVHYGVPGKLTFESKLILRHLLCFPIPPDAHTDSLRYLLMFC